ncbi:hypothetical protein H3H36_07630 [Duganella sp. FT3S]|uniref:Uncharacterized protein n=1 Tax=Rugamonas fusca TaxID=2758568 RepID=A0A7W2I6D3_9BURK|nr:hypothetical protein [Rugamonas fusca]MBA5605225.1 hypothetical protein [Rugamonas fusca]
MTIFLDLAGQTATAFNNFDVVSGQSGGVGLLDVVGDATMKQLTYDDVSGQLPTADRLSALANTDFGAPIIVTALNGGNDPYKGNDITGNAQAYTDHSPGHLVIRIVYDVSQCCGKGIVARNNNGDNITVPNPVLLYHEMAHVFLEVNHQPDVESSVIGDENVLRAQLGQCLRNVNDHEGGCGDGSDCGGNDGGPDSGPPPGGCAAGTTTVCFVVSAATGSAQSDEVHALRQLRARVAARSVLAARLIDVVYAEYAQFSPAIANRIEGDVLARRAVLLAVVRPLLAWYSLAGALAFDGRGEASRRAARALAAACPRYVGSALLVEMLDALATGRALPAAASPLLRGLGPELRTASSLRCARWAVFDPLARAWRAAAGGANAAHGAHPVDVVEEVAQWLAQAPLELVPCIAPRNDGVASRAGASDEDWLALASLFGFQPSALRTLGTRLAAAWPQADAMLARCGYL